MIDTYEPADPDPYPAFFEHRVYQGSDGGVYPLPFVERISAEKRPREWLAIHLENEFVRLVMLPGLGGRIHVGYDKVAGYDFFYRNNVIKPALVGLAGPWISGGVEFNWPQHHRPATFLPTDWHLEEEPDGSVTAWFSDHDPMKRMKGMHGIRLRPGSSLIEARVRLYNRTDDVQTFLWWANVAAAANDEYQSFFPTDVRFVADHAKRAVATFPEVDGHYYGVDYPGRVAAERPDGDRLDWYRNIPVPTSYMVTHTRDDFFGGYDHGERAGFVHVADRRIAPGKKQWTWGDAEFGWAWDRNLTDTDGPYVELMAGAFTDNQPDFSFIAPGETKAFSQYWFPIREIGPAHQANTDAALRLDVETDGEGSAVRLGVVVTRTIADPRIELLVDGVPVLREVTTLTPAEPAVIRFAHGDRLDPLTVTARVFEGDDLVIEWRARPEASVDPISPATAPPPPADIVSADELYLTGEYLAQYRHATRAPEPYWREALRRDPGDARSNTALARRLRDEGRFAEAETHLRRAVERLTARVPNVADGEAHYRLGVVLVDTGRSEEALDALAKSAWDAAWRVPAGYLIGRIHAAAARYRAAADALDEVLALDTRHSQAIALRARVARELGGHELADRLLTGLLERDPLDQWARHLAGLDLSADAPTLLDVAIEFVRAGFDRDALAVLDLAAEATARTAPGQVQVAPLVAYHRADILARSGDVAGAAAARADARRADARYALASRLEDVAALEAAIQADPTDAVAGSLLGSWLYDRRRYDEAIAAWRHAAAEASAPLTRAVVQRNLGVAAYNVLRDSGEAARHYASARAAAPADAKLLFEADQLAARIGVPESARLAELESDRALVSERDDLTVVLANLLTNAGRSDEAVELLSSRRFQPWEGGEGVVLAAWEAAQAGVAEAALSAGDPAAAVAALRSAIDSPEHLGEARHPLANIADLLLRLGDARHAAGDVAGAEDAWMLAAHSVGDFRGMSTHEHGRQSLASVRALRRLGREDDAAALARAVAAYVERIAAEPAVIDFFATSLPSMLLFHDDPQDARDAEVRALHEGLVALERESRIGLAR